VKLFKGKASTPVYVRLKKRSILKGEVFKTVEFRDGVNFDLDKDGKILGWEFLDCYGICVDGKEI